MFQRAQQFLKKFSKYKYRLFKIFHPPKMESENDSNIEREKWLPRVRTRKIQKVVRAYKDLENNLQVMGRGEGLLLEIWEEERPGGRRPGLLGREDRRHLTYSLPKIERLHGPLYL
jgi:hypothetical protein